MTTEASVSNSKRYWLVLQCFIGLFAFWLLFSQIDLEQWRNAWNEAEWGLVLVTLLFPFVVHFTTWMSFQYLTIRSGFRLPGGLMYRAILLSESIGLFGPGRLGDFSIIWIYKKYGVPYTTGMCLTVFNKIIAVGFTVWLGIVGAAIWFDRFDAQIAAIALPCLAGLIWYTCGAKIPKPLLDRILKNKSGQHINSFLQSWNNLLNVNNLLICIGFAFLKALAMALMPFVLFRAYNYPIGIEEVIFVSALVRLTTIIPITPAGIGIRELTGALLYSEIGGFPTAVTANVMVISTGLHCFVAACCYFGNLKVVNVSAESQLTSAKEQPDSES